MGETLTIGAVKIQLRSPEDKQDDRLRRYWIEQGFITPGTQILHAGVRPVMSKEAVQAYKAKLIREGFLLPKGYN